MNPGDRLRVDGEVGEFFGQIQIGNVSAIERLEEAGPVPAPLVLSAADADAAEYEGMLIQVTGDVTAVGLPAGPGDSDPTGEFELDDVLKVNDYFYALDPEAAEGDRLQITGILRFANNSFKLEPRGEDDVVILDGAPPMLRSFGPANLQVEDGGIAEMTLVLNRPAPEGGQEATITNSNPDRLTAPTSVVVPEGSREVVFEVTGVVIGDNPVLLTATVNDGPGQVARVTVVDEILVPQVGLVISEVFYNPDSSDGGKEWVEIFNGTNSSVDLSEYSLGSGGQNYTTLTAQLSGIIEPGGCFVVGGPTSDASNFNPSFDQVLEFSPNIQNSGGDADAVGLFNLDAESINAGSVPVDAVVYGGANTNGFVNSSGEAGEPDVGDAGSGNSIERAEDEWRVQEAPTPNDCTALAP